MVSDNSEPDIQQTYFNSAAEHLSEYLKIHFVSVTKLLHPITDQLVYNENDTEHTNALWAEWKISEH